MNWHSLPVSNELIWFKERDNWGSVVSLRPDDGKTGKHQITHGEALKWDAGAALVDEANRMIYFLAVEKQPGLDPYYSQLYRIDW